LRFCILASGSTGNATIVANDEVCLLIDAGLSAKKLEQLMKEREVEGRELQAILVTHEHSDHIKGLGALARKYKLPIYANANTWNEIDRQLGEIEDDQRRIMATGETVEFGSIRVESYAISHDAAEPVGYVFYEDDMKLSLATDLGYVSPKVKEKISDSDVLIIESNHDVGMLRMGRYPWNVKRRILGDTGHLSNDAAGDALCELATDRTKRVYLAHLSRDHNMLDLAKLTVHNILQDQGITQRLQRLQLMDTFYDRPTRWDMLRSE
jgi:phosphoribosyl 1,2-cyclic phosphodiesterase